MLKAVLLLFTSLFSGSHQQCFSSNDNNQFLGPQEINNWVASRHNFSLSLMRLLNSERSQKNVLFSPSTIVDSLLLAYFGAAGPTEESLARVLQIPDNQNKAVTWRFYSNQKLIQIRNQGLPDSLKSANKFFLSNKLSLRPCMEERFENELEMVDYEIDAEGTRNYINKWVENRTAGQITNYVKYLRGDPIVTMVNGAYFKTVWEEGFNSENTQYMPFRVNEYESRKINMLSKEGLFAEGRSSQLGARLLWLPFSGNKSAMVIILPDKNLHAVIESMSDRILQFLADQRNYVPVKMKVYIPKFEHRNEIELDKALEILGIGDALSESADYSGFTGYRDVFLSSLVHQVAIKIDEEGAKTVAAGGLFELGSRDLDYEPFICDRPFAYIIYHYEGRKIIFMGTFRDPEKASDDVKRRKGTE